MDKLRVISADSHMTEPPDLWTVRLDRRFQEQAPRGVRRPDKPGHFSTAPGITPFPVAGGFSTGWGGEALKAHLNSGYEVARPSGWDPVERLTDQDINGLEAEVLYTIPGLALFQLSDVALQQACFRVCNDWVAGFRSHSPKRLHPVALIPLEEIPAAVAELHRVAKPGLKGGMIQGRSAKPSDYARRQVWATFQDDPVGPANYRFFGAENCMWTSDFPHTDTTWPNSRRVIARDFVGVPARITRKIVSENAARLCRIELE